MFTKQSGEWTQVVKLTASDEAAGDYFGWSVAVHGDTVVVGAYRADGNSGESGAVYVFRGANWQVLTRPNPTTPQSYYYMHAPADIASAYGIRHQCFALRNMGYTWATECVTQWVSQNARMPFVKH